MFNWAKFKCLSKLQTLRVLSQARDLSVCGLMRSFLNPQSIRGKSEDKKVCVEMLLAPTKQQMQSAALLSQELPKYDN